MYFRGRTRLRESGAFQSKSVCSLSSVFNISLYFFFSSGLMDSMCFAISNTSAICTEVQGLLGFPKTFVSLFPKRNIIEKRRLEKLGEKLT